MRRAICLACLLAALALTIIPTLAKVLMPSPRFTSIHQAEDVLVMMGFAADSAVNIADAKELDCLPGIGEVLSQRIVELREALGGYRLPEDLLLVKGIGEKTLHGIMDALTEPLVPLLPTGK